MLSNAGARAAVIVDAAFVRQTIERGALVWDVRAKVDFRKGHIRGAVNIPYEQNWQDPATQQKLAQRRVRDSIGMSPRSPEELKKLYAALDLAKETVVMCQSGVRAAQTASVLQGLGLRNVRVYDSSWLGYADKVDAPAENEVFLNVGQMNQLLSGADAGPGCSVTL